MLVGFEKELFDEFEQENFGKEIAKNFSGLIFLEGDLGAGKTTLTRGIAEFFDINHVSSPTYALMHNYQNKDFLFVHVDAYRINYKEELYEIGLEEIIEDANFIVIEWGQKFYDDFPKAPIFQLLYKGDHRLIKRIR